MEAVLHRSWPSGSDDDPVAVVPPVTTNPTPPVSAEKLLAFAAVAMGYSLFQGTRSRRNLAARDALARATQAAGQQPVDRREDDLDLMRLRQAMTAALDDRHLDIA